jgi:hypothetical protein
MAKKPKTGTKMSYGIAELYGDLFSAIPNERRIKLISLKKEDRPDCEFLRQAPELGPKNGSPKCNKASGVCSIRNFLQSDDGEPNFGPITATCPIRFYENKTIFEEISEILLGNRDARVVKEIPFLKRSKKTAPGDVDDDIENDKESVGRIDMVMAVERGTEIDWCAVELQAVYFSGGKIADDYPAIKKHTGNGVPMPGANRRPDFRSSGPKRLMPQLQIKVPTLRRWGKKMAVVIDRPFFDALGEMDPVEDISNCDIAWVIVRFEEDSGTGKAHLKIDEIRYTTLERAVEGLTAGVPTTLTDFEDKIRAKLSV